MTKLDQAFALTVTGTYLDGISVTLAKVTDVEVTHDDGDGIYGLSIGDAGVNVGGSFGGRSLLQALSGRGREESARRIDSTMVLTSLEAVEAKLTKIIFDTATNGFDLEGEAEDVLEHAQQTCRREAQKLIAELGAKEVYEETVSEARRVFNETVEAAAAPAASTS